MLLLPPALYAMVALAPIGTMATVINPPVAHVSPIVQGAVVAGVFSVVNTILNFRVLQVASQNRANVEKVKDYAEEVHGQLDRRGRNYPPPDGVCKRKDDAK